MTPAIGSEIATTLAGDSTEPPFLSMCHASYQRVRGSRSAPTLEAQTAWRHDCPQTMADSQPTTACYNPSTSSPPNRDDREEAKLDAKSNAP